jgi:ATP-binding protein involved in chromosome partitioning
MDGVDGARRLVDRARAAVGAVVDPETELALGEVGMVRRVAVDGPIVRVEVALAPAQLRSGNAISDAVAAAVGEEDGVERVEVLLQAMTDAEERHAMEALRRHQPADPPHFVDGATKVVLVTSGKGGVGKSTVAVNLACALAARGMRIGLLDADVWGYSVPRMLGSTGDPVGIGEMLLPERVQGLKAVSIGFLADEGSPVVWRGPMLHEAISQFISGVYWGPLDVLIADLPPGTGDVPMSLANLVPGANVLVVTTPQEAAYRVAERAGRMATQAKLRIVGVVENMAGFVCEHCGHGNDIFGGSGGQVLADALAVPLLGQVPISVALRQGADRGRPVVLDAPHDPAALALVAIAVDLERRAKAVVRKRLAVPIYQQTPVDRSLQRPAALTPSGGVRP